MTTDQKTEAPPPLDIAALLADEAAADTPVKIADLKPFLEQHRGAIVEEVTTSLRAQRQQEEQRRAEAEERNASAKSDMDWALDLDKRLDSPDEAVRAQAKIDKDAGKTRYLRGLSLSYEAGSAQTRDRAIAEHVNPLLAHLQKQGQQPFLDALANPAELAKHEGNYLLMAIKMGEAAGYERGKAEAAEAAERDGRIDAGTKLPPGLNGGGGNGAPSKLTEGITLGQPGSTRLLRQRLATQQKQ